MYITFLGTRPYPTNHNSSADNCQDALPLSINFTEISLIKTPSITNATKLANDDQVSSDQDDNQSQSEHNWTRWKQEANDWLQRLRHESDVKKNHIQSDEHQPPIQSSKVNQQQTSSKDSESLTSPTNGKVSKSRLTRLWQRNSLPPFVRKVQSQTVQTYRQAKQKVFSSQLWNVISYLENKSTHPITKK